MLDFTRIIQDDLIKIGCVFGSDKVLFIKCGQGGTIYGHGNMYLDFALKFNRKYGCTVMVSEILSDGREAFDREMETVCSLLGEGCRLCCLGISKGGLLTLWHGAENRMIERIATVNAPLMLNFHNRTLPAILKRPREELTLYYGTNDPSFSYVPFVETRSNTVIIENASHNLTPAELEPIIEQMCDRASVAWGVH